MRVSHPFCTDALIVISVSARTDIASGSMRAGESAQTHGSAIGNRRNCAGRLMSAQLQRALDGPPDLLLT